MPKRDMNITDAYQVVKKATNMDEVLHGVFEIENPLERTEILEIHVHGVGLLFDWELKNGVINAKAYYRDNRPMGFEITWNKEQWFTNMNYGDTVVAGSAYYDTTLWIDRSGVEPYTKTIAEAFMQAKGLMLKLLSDNMTEAELATIAEIEEGK